MIYKQCAKLAILVGVIGAIIYTCVLLVWTALVSAAPSYEIYPTKWFGAIVASRWLDVALLPIAALIYGLIVRAGWLIARKNGAPTYPWSTHSCKKWFCLTSVVEAFHLSLWLSAVTTFCLGLYVGLVNIPIFIIAYPIPFLIFTYLISLCNKKHFRSGFLIPLNYDRKI